MSKYFTSVYKNYYDKISADKNIETNVNSLNDKLTSLDTATKTFINYFESSNWNEKGKLELINSYLPKIVKNTNILRNNVSYNMSKVVNLVKNDLYNLLVELKERDEEYCKLQDSIRNDYLEEEDLVYKKSKLELMESLIVNVVNNIDKKD